MNVTCDQKRLQDALQAVSPLAPKSPALKILSCVLLEADDETDVLRLTTTDLEAALQVEIPAVIDEAGKRLALPCKIVQSLVAIGGSDRVTIQSIGKKWNGKIVLGQSQHRVNGQDPDEFPSVSWTGQEIGRIPMDLAQDAISWALPCVAASEGRPALASLAITCDDQGNTEFCGADGHRLAFMTLDQCYLSSEPMLIPRSSVRKTMHFWRMQADGDEMPCTVFKRPFLDDVTGGGHSQKLIVGLPGMRVAYMLLADPAYPAYKKIVPGDWRVRAQFDIGDMVDSLKMVNVFDDLGAGVHKTRVTIDLGESEAPITLFGRDAEAGDVKTCLAAEVSQAESPSSDLTFTFHLNGRWVREQLAILAGSVEKAELTGLAHNKPFVMRAVGSEHWKRATFVIMPLITDLADMPEREDNA